MKKIYIKINCKGKRTVGKTHKGIHVRKNTIGLKKLKIKIIKKWFLKKGRKKKKEKKEKPHRTSKAQHRGRGK